MRGVVAAGEARLRRSQATSRLFESTAFSPFVSVRAERSRSAFHRSPRPAALARRVNRASRSPLGILDSSKQGREDLYLTKRRQATHGSRRGWDLARSITRVSSGVPSSQLAGDGVYATDLSRRTTRPSGSTCNAAWAIPRNSPCSTTPETAFTAIASLTGSSIGPVAQSRM